MDYAMRIVLIILILGFLLYMVRYTRDESWIFIFITISVLPILALVDSIVRARPPLTNPNWDSVINPYLFAVIVIGIGYTEFRRYWPYPRMKTDRLWKMVKMLYNEGDTKQAWRVARQLMAKEPRWWDVRFMLGCICNQRGHYRRAIWHLNFANELQPNRVEVLHELGYAYLMRKRYFKAKSLLEQAHQIDANNQAITGLLEQCRREMALK